MKPLSPPPSPPPRQAAAPPRIAGATAALLTTMPRRADFTLQSTPPRPLSPGVAMEGPLTCPPAPKKSRRGGARAARVVFTINNPSADVVKTLCSFLADTSFVSYAAFGYEVAPLTGTPHLQGFACALSSTCPALSSWRAKLKGAHIEPMKGTLEQNEAYCRKVYREQWL